MHEQNGNFLNAFYLISKEKRYLFVFLILESR
jgi:hypothetical protein